MKRITALPIKGESFLLEYLGKKILVDGGYASSKVGKALKEQLGATTIHLDIVVCTHGDRDHAGGLVDILDVDGVTVSEFWLPGSWSGVVEELVERPKEFYREYVDEVRKGDIGDLTRLSDEDVAAIDERLEALASNVVVDEEHKEESREGRELKLYPPDIPIGRNVSENAKRAIKRWNDKGSVGKRAIDLIDTAERVRKIALSACKHRVLVRWFDYLAYSKDRKANGGEAYLKPVNSKERRTPPVLKIDLRRFVALSRVNRESLVFLSADEDPHVEILFCGDSPLGDGPRYSNSFLTGRRTDMPLIATAPHHGADSNQMAYGHIAAFGDVAYWIRAGGHSHHPESAYRSIPPERRTCTQCPHNTLPLKSVTITDKLDEFADRKVWLRVRAHDCTC